MQRRTLLGVAVLLTAGCVAPPAGVAASDTSRATERPSTTATEIPTVPYTSTTSTSPPAPTLPSSDTTFGGVGPAEFLVAGPDGIWTVTGEGTTRISPLAAVVAFDDRRGGLVALADDRAAGITPWQIGTRIGRLRPGRSVEWVVSHPGFWIELHDVVEIGGRPQAVFSRIPDIEAGDEGSGLQELYLLDLEGGESRHIVTVDVGEGAMDVGYADGRFVVTVSAEGDSWFEFYDETGDSLSFPGTPAGRTYPEAVGSGRLVGTASDPQLVYLEYSDVGSEAESAELVVVRLRDGVELGRRPLPSGAWTATRLDVAGGRVVVSGLEVLDEPPWYQPGHALVTAVDHASEWSELPVPGAVTFVDPVGSSDP